MLQRFLDRQRRASAGLKYRPCLLHLAGQRAVRAERRREAGNCVKAQVVLLAVSFWDGRFMSFLAARLRVKREVFFVCVFCAQF